jgi:hypothetical protein
MSRLPTNPLEVVLAGLRTDAELLRKILELLPDENNAARKAILAEIESQIRVLEYSKHASLSSSN